MATTFDPESYSGRLPHHRGPCPRADYHESGEDCDGCQRDTDGRRMPAHYRAWYSEDVGECEDCGAQEVPIAGYYDGPVEWVCLPCVLRDHAKTCGCDRWRHAEDAAGIVRTGAVA